MTFSESIDIFNSKCDDCDITINQISILNNYCYNEYEISIKELAINVMLNNGTKCDYEFLIAESKEEYFQKATKLILKLVETIKNFINTCKQRLDEIIESTKVNYLTNKYKKIYKDNPGIKHVKISFNNTDEKRKEAENGISHIKTHLARIKSKGFANSEDNEKLNNIEETVNAEMNKLNNVADTVTISEALDIFKNIRNEKQDDMCAEDSEIMQTSLCKDTYDSHTVNHIVNCCELISKLRKESASCTVIKATSLWSSLKIVFNKYK